MPGANALHLQAVFMYIGDNIDNNNMISLKLLRKADWPALEMVDTSKG
jgi:hypothetical protein